MCATFRSPYIYILLLPVWSKAHPWNALFHFSFFILRKSVALLERGDRLVASPLITKTQNKGRQADIETLIGIRTHDPSVTASEDSSCVGPAGHYNLY
jgi:hypothetical protein